jgi:hypothetical protein
VNERTLERVVTLVSEALREMEGGQVLLSATIQRGIRIARLRNDWDGVWWLEMELREPGDRVAAGRIAAEIRPHYAPEEFRRTQARVIEAYREERTVGRDLRAEKGRPTEQERILFQSVQAIERGIVALQQLQSVALPFGRGPVDLMQLDGETLKIGVQTTTTLKWQQNVLDRIAHRVHEYLSGVEKQLLYGQIQADVFERNRRYVDAKLRAVAPEAAEQFVAAYKRAEEKTPESRSQAVTSCRRILKTIADHVYPPRKSPVRGSDGVERTLDESKYLSRLWQYVHESIGETSAGTLLCRRIDSLQDVASKGVHDDVSEFETDMCLIQTYLAVGDILRIWDRTSAATEDDVGDE